MARNTLVLFSGGLDSVVLTEQLHRAGRLAGAVHFIYPHPAQSHERRVVIEMRRRFYTETGRDYFREVDLPIRAKELQIGTGRPGPRIVPVRNLAMLAVAANLADSFGATRIAIGATDTDASGYADCSRSYLATVSRLVEPFGLQVDAPFLDRSRADVWEMARDLGISPRDVWSCYEPAAGKPCGACNSCRQGIDGE